MASKKQSGHDKIFMDFCPQKLEQELTNEIIGHKIYYFEEIGSTNDEAYRLGVRGAIEGTVVIADSQKSGKGRLKRTWYSPPRTNIYTSIILRPDFLPSEASRITIMAGLAIAETINKLSPGKVRVKWPNDILINGKKVCGILAQMKMSKNKIGFIVLGVGINVNMYTDKLPQDIKDIATSLMEQTGNFYSRQELLIELYKNLSKWYKILLNNDFNKIRKKWLNVAALIGRSIQVKFKDEVIEGKALSIDEYGALDVAQPKGGIVKILAGDASILKEN